MRTPLNFVLRLVGHACTAAVESTWGFTAVGGCSLGGVVMTATDTGTDGWPRTLVQESTEPHLPPYGYMPWDNPKGGAPF